MMANDLWQTPDYVYRWLDDIFRFNLGIVLDPFFGYGGDEMNG